MGKSRTKYKQKYKNLKLQFTHKNLKFTLRAYYNKNSLQVLLIKHTHIYSQQVFKWSHDQTKICRMTQLKIVQPPLKNISLRKKRRLGNFLSFAKFLVSAFLTSL